MRFMMIMKPNVDEEHWAPPPRRSRRWASSTRSLIRPACCSRSTACGRRRTARRVAFSGGTATVTDGPFTESKELIGGYWLVQAKSKEEAVQWASRCPAEDGDVIEVRQVYELSDFE